MIPQIPPPRHAGTSSSGKKGPARIDRAADSTSRFRGILVVSILSSLLLRLVAGTGSVVLVHIVAIIFMIIEITLTATFCKNLSACFGKGTGFAVGLFFLSPIFMDILAFGSARHYNQPAVTPVHDETEKSI